MYEINLNEIKAGNANKMKKIWNKKLRRFKFRIRGPPLSPLFC